MKKNLMTFPLIAKTMAGLENVLAEELEQIGVCKIEVLNRAVSFEATQRQLYETNYLCRTALRILKPIASFKIESEDEFYLNVLKINWEKYFSFHNTFAIDATISNSIFTHSQYVALRCKDAVADRFRNKFHHRPSVDTQQPDIRIHEIGRAHV